MFLNRPPIVCAGLDEVYLIVALLAVLACVHLAGRRVPCQPLYVAVAVRIHRRAFKRVVFRYAAVSVQPEDLAGKRAAVLRKLGLPRVACRDVQLAVGSEFYPAAIVPGGRRDPVDYD